MDMVINSTLELNILMTSIVSLWLDNLIYANNSVVS